VRDEILERFGNDNSRFRTKDLIFPEYDEPGFE